jgi:hypothetical protein
MIKHNPNYSIALFVENAENGYIVNHLSKGIICRDFIELINVMAKKFGLLEIGEKVEINSHTSNNKAEEEMMYAAASKS